MWLSTVIWCSVFAVLADGGAESRSTLLMSSGSDQLLSQVLVKRLNETLTLKCTSERDATNLVWFLPEKRPVLSNDSDQRISLMGNQLQVSGLRIEDSGHYTCSLPPDTVSQYVLVQPPAAAPCMRGGFSCGRLCVLPLFVCDGRADCTLAEDESAHTCGTLNPCLGKLQCRDGRCLAPAWCWREGSGGHSCCELHMPPDPPPARAGVDYGLIQSTIYTVTACALIFMVAVVLLVSAICKMHLKRAALREYARAHPHALHPPPSRYSYPTHQMCDEGQRADSCVDRLLSRLALQPHYSSGCARSREAVTLRLGRLRVAVPRLTPRTAAAAPAELQALRSSGDTYTLNGRTIRLLGADIACGAPAPPPPYSPAPRKSRGPPPQYISTDRLHCTTDTYALPALDESDADSCEAPPGYEQRA